MPSPPGKHPADAWLDPADEEIQGDYHKFYHQKNNQRHEILHHTKQVARLHVFKKIRELRFDAICNMSDSAERIMFSCGTPWKYNGRFSANAPSVYWKYIKNNKNELIQVAPRLLSFPLGEHQTFWLRGSADKIWGTVETACPFKTPRLTQREKNQRDKAWAILNLRPDPLVRRQNRKDGTVTHHRSLKGWIQYTYPNADTYPMNWLDVQIDELKGRGLLEPVCSVDDWEEIETFLLMYSRTPDLDVPALVQSMNHSLTVGAAFVGHPHSGPSHLGPSYPGPSYSGPSYSGPSPSGPSQAGPSHPSPSRPDPSHSGPSRPGPSHPGPPHPGPSLPSPSRPSQAGPSHPGPSQPASRQLVPGQSEHVQSISRSEFLSESEPLTLHDRPSPNAGVIGEGRPALAPLTPRTTTPAREQPPPQANDHQLFGRTWSSPPFTPAIPFDTALGPLPPPLNTRPSSVPPNSPSPDFRTDIQSRNVRVPDIPFSFHMPVFTALNGLALGAGSCQTKETNNIASILDTWGKNIISSTRFSLSSTSASSPQTPPFDFTPTRTSSPSTSGLYFVSPSENTNTELESSHELSGQNGIYIMSTSDSISGALENRLETLIQNDTRTTTPVQSTDGVSENISETTVPNAIPTTILSKGMNKASASIPEPSEQNSTYTITTSDSVNRASENRPEASGPNSTSSTSPYRTKNGAPATTMSRSSSSEQKGTDTTISPRAKIGAPARLVSESSMPRQKGRYTTTPSASTNGGSASSPSTSRARNGTHTTAPPGNRDGGTVRPNFMDGSWRQNNTRTTAHAGSKNRGRATTDSGRNSISSAPSNAPTEPRSMRAAQQYAMVPVGQMGQSKTGGRAATSPVQTQPTSWRIVKREDRDAEEMMEEFKKKGKDGTENSDED